MKSTDSRECEAGLHFCTYSVSLLQYYRIQVSLKNLFQNVQNNTFFIEYSIFCIETIQDIGAR